MERIHQKLNEIVDKNPKLASVLNFLGIYFYNYAENTLEEVCKERGLDPLKVIEKFNEVANASVKNKINLIDYPIELIIEYLKHSHYIFIKEKLTFLSRTIENYPDGKSEIIQELKLVFPHLMQEFIEHVYEEEDTVFNYILLLRKMLTDERNPDEMKSKLKDQSLLDLAEEHSHHDDEMKEIRELTQNFMVSSTMDAHTKVIFENLKEFSEDLKNHAKIENEVLFPKAIALEKEVKAKIAV